MKRNVSEYEFVNAFDEWGRETQFSRSGRFALYDYLTMLEEDTGTEIEFDVVGICCEFQEYTSIKEYNDAYDTDYTEEGFIDECCCANYDDDLFIVYQH